MQRLCDPEFIHFTLRLVLLIAEDGRLGRAGLEDFIVFATETNGATRGEERLVVEDFFLGDVDSLLIFLLPVTGVAIELSEAELGPEEDVFAGFDIGSQEVIAVTIDPGLSGFDSLLKGGC